MPLGHVMQRLRRGDFAYLRYLAAVRWYGLDVHAVSLNELGLSSERSVAYETSGGPDLDRVLRQVGIPPQSRVLDLGSGKGGACLTLARHFAEVVGVELSPALVRIAEQNAIKAGVRVNLICADAATFTDFDRFSHLYLFNPFPPVVLTAVMQHLRASLIRRPRPFTLIYKYPGMPSVEPSLFALKRVIRLPLSHPFFVFNSTSQICTV